MGQQQTVSELTGDEGGVWRVTTVGSSHILNLDRGTVTRIPGRGLAASINDVERPIRSIEVCRVGALGHWTMTADRFLTDFYWQRTSSIQRIERLTGMALGEANTEVAFQNIQAADGMFLGRRRDRPLTASRVGSVTGTTLAIPGRRAPGASSVAATDRPWARDDL